MANILNADNGAISGSAGIKLSSDTSGVLNIQTNGTTAISISSSQVVSFPATTSIGTLYFAAGTAATPSISVTGDTNTGIYFPAADTIAFTEGGVESMRIDASGNMGLGVTPSAWGTASSSKAMQIGTSLSFLSFGSGGEGAHIGGNTYWDGTNWRYLNTRGALRYELDNAGSSHKWYNAPSGTAGNAITFTQAMTLDASGNLGIGTSSPSQLVEAVKSSTGDVAYQVTNANTGSAATAQFFASNGTTRTQFFHTGTNYAGTGVLNAAGLGGIYNSTASGISLAADNAAGTIKFAAGGTTERMRLSASGMLGLGVTPSAWDAGFPTLQLGNYGVFLSGRNSFNQLFMGTNSYFDGANWKYANTASASRYYQNGGAHLWDYAASGTAGTNVTWTQGMGLDTAGNLALGLAGGGTGTASPNYITLGSYFADSAGAATKTKLRVFQNSTDIYGFGVSSYLLENHVPSNASVAWFINNSERMRLNTSGYLTVPNQPMFAAEHNATEGPTAGDAFVNWNVTVNTVTAAWNASTGVYTVPVAGRYFVACSLLRNTGSGSGGVYLQQNGTNVIRLFYCDSGSADSGYAMGSGQTIVNCAINDTLRVTQETSGVSWYGDGTGLGNFTIYLIG